MHELQTVQALGQHRANLRIAASGTPADPCRPRFKGRQGTPPPRRSHAGRPGRRPACRGSGRQGAAAAFGMFGNGFIAILRAPSRNSARARRPELLHAIHGSAHPPRHLRELQSLQVAQDQSPPDSPRAAGPGRRPAARPVPGGRPARWASSACRPGPGPKPVRN